VSEVAIVRVLSLLCKSLDVNHKEIGIFYLVSPSSFIYDYNVGFVLKVDFRLELNINSCIK